MIIFLGATTQAWLNRYHYLFNHKPVKPVNTIISVKNTLLLRLKYGAFYESFSGSLKETFMGRQKSMGQNQTKIYGIDI